MSRKYNTASQMNALFNDTSYLKKAEMDAMLENALERAAEENAKKSRAKMRKTVALTVLAISGLIIAEKLGEAAKETEIRNNAIPVVPVSDDPIKAYATPEVRGTMNMIDGKTNL